MKSYEPVYQETYKGVAYYCLCNRSIMTQTWNQFINTHRGQNHMCNGVLYNREMSELELRVLTQNKVQQ